MFKIDFNFLYKELDDLNITVYDFELETCNALTIKLDDKYYIAINKNNNYSEIMKFWLIQHELEHIKHNSMYHINDDKFIINKNERITNDAVILKLGLIETVLLSLIEGKDKWNICDDYDIPSEIYECCIDYIKRKGLSAMTNCVDILCKKNGYDVETLSKKLGCTIEEAKDIINEKGLIKYDYLMRLCQIFNVSQEYILCL